MQLIYIFPLTFPALCKPTHSYIQSAVSTHRRGGAAHAHTHTHRQRCISCVCVCYHCWASLAEPSHRLTLCGDRRSNPWLCVGADKFWEVFFSSSARWNETAKPFLVAFLLIFPRAAASSFLPLPLPLMPHMIFVTQASFSIVPFVSLHSEHIPSLTLHSTFFFCFSPETTQLNPFH